MPTQKGDPGDSVLVFENEKGGRPDLIRFLDDLDDLTRHDSAVITEMITNHQNNAKMLEEELKRRDKARGRAILAKAEEDLAALRVERKSIQSRNEAIDALEWEIQLIQRDEDLRMASIDVPPATTNKKCKCKKKRVVIRAPDPPKPQPV
jgi:hypothetical protein